MHSNRSKDKEEVKESEALKKHGIYAKPSTLSEVLYGKDNQLPDADLCELFTP